MKALVCEFLRRFLKKKKTKTPLGIPMYFLRNLSRLSSKHFLNGFLNFVRGFYRKFVKKYEALGNEFLQAFFQEFYYKSSIEFSGFSLFLRNSEFVWLLQYSKKNYFSNFSRDFLKTCFMDSFSNWCSGCLKKSSRNSFIYFSSDFWYQFIKCKIWGYTRLQALAFGKLG